MLCSFFQKLAIRAALSFPSLRHVYTLYITLLFKLNQLLFVKKARERPFPVFHTPFPFPHSTFLRAAPDAQTPYTARADIDFVPVRPGFSYGRRSRGRELIFVVDQCPVNVDQ